MGKITKIDDGYDSYILGSIVNIISINIADKNVLHFLEMKFKLMIVYQILFWWNNYKLVQTLSVITMFHKLKDLKKQSISELKHKAKRLGITENVVREYINKLKKNRESIQNFLGYPVFINTNARMKYSPCLM